MRHVALGLATATIATVSVFALGESLTRAVVGAPARFLYTGSLRDSQTDFDVEYGVSPQGLRKTCGPVADAGGGRVAVLGDSFVFGQGVADCEDFVSLLNLASRDERLVNFGVIGAGIEDYRLVARDLLDDADAVVVVFFGNDVMVGARRPARRLADHSSALALVRRARRAWIVHRARGAPGSEGPIAYLDGRPNNILSLLRQSSDAVRVMVEPAHDDAEMFRASFAKLAATLTRRFGSARVWITCVPDGQTVSRRLARFIRDHGGAVAPFGAPGPAYELVRELSGEHGLRFVDVFAGFAPDGDELYHPHDLHWTAAGHRRMAELLAEPLGLSAAGRSRAEAARGARVAWAAAR